VEGDELHVPGFRALRLGDTVEGGGVVGEMKRDQASADLIACARSGEDPIAYVRFFPGG
jgi:hypothetical protein